MIQSLLSSIVTLYLLAFPMLLDESNYSGKFAGDGVSIEGELRKFKEVKEIVAKLLPNSGDTNSGTSTVKRKDTPPKVALPYCTDVTETDAWNLDCLQTQIGVCPNGEYLLVEYRIENEMRIKTGRTFCSATNDVEAAPGTVVEATQPIEIVVTLRDLQRLDVGASKILSGNMKRDGKYVGLRKRPIHMWTEAGVVNRSITMFGRNVQVRLTPVSYNWSFGDGTSQKAVAQESRADSPSSGKVRTSHSYTDTGTYDAQVTVNYAGQFRVGDEDWVPVVGILEIPSETASMDIWRKKVYPVADDCDANPQGWGCDSLFQETKPNP